MRLKHFFFLLIFKLSCFSEPSFSNFELDVDDDAKTEALSDGLLIIRFMFGLDETSLITDAVGLNATRDSSDEIIDYLSANSEKLDIDQNGQIDALTDGILILRDLFGITGEMLVIGALAENATRINSQEISDYLKTIKDSDGDGVFDSNDAFPLDPLRSSIDEVSTTPPNIEWITSISGSEEESHAHFILASREGGYLQVGETGFIPNSAKILVVKISENGQLEWKKEIGVRGHNLGNSLIEIDDGYLVVGAINEDSAIIKIDKHTGSIIYVKTYDQGGSDAFENVVETTEGFIAVGYRYAEDRQNTFFTEGQGLMTFLDRDGNQTGSKNIDSLIAHPYRIKKFNDEMLISGLSEDALDYTLIKTDILGNLIWRKTFGGESYDHNFAFDVNSDGSFFMSGHTLSNTENWDTYTVKTDNDGVIEWTNTLGNPRGFNARFIHDEAWGIKATIDGGALIIAGTGDEYESYSECNDFGCSDRWRAYLIRLDASGDLIWEATYGDEEADWAGEDICFGNDGSLILAIDNGQFGFVKLSAVN